MQDRQVVQRVGWADWFTLTKTGHPEFPRLSAAAIAGGTVALFCLGEEEKSQPWRDQWRYTLTS